MLKPADEARARSIESRIHGKRVSGGAYSPFARLHEKNIAAAAAHIAATHPSEYLDEDGLLRAVQRYEARYPQSTRSLDEVTANLRQARANEVRPVPVRAIDKTFLKKLTARERLEFVNESGRLPTRFVLKGPDDE